MDAFMCYGPVVPDGYGVCYNPHPEWILVCVTSFKRHHDTHSDHFAFTLESSLLQMQELCLKTREPRTVLLNGERPNGGHKNGARGDERNASPGTRKSKLVRQRTMPFPEVNGKWNFYVSEKSPMSFLEKIIETPLVVNVRVAGVNIKAS